MHLTGKDTGLPIRKLLTGNEAVARGAWEAGAIVGCGYPGTPSTEILEAFATYPAVRCEWSVNEKVAVEVALGASLAGARCLVTMKHVGVNVAADPLFTAAYTGVKGGLVIVTADEPDMYSSQNEQDNRNYAIAAKIPMLEPSDSEEARRFTRMAFELSEQFDTPVFLRTTTRLSHSESIVAMDDEAGRAEPGRPGFERNPSKYVMIPTHARMRRREVAQRMENLCVAAESHPANRLEPGLGTIGFITSGIPYTYVKEVFPDAPVLKIGLVHPMPRRLIEDFAHSMNTLYVVEELDPIIEMQLRAWGIDCIGKAVFPTMGELSPDLIRSAFDVPLLPHRESNLSVPLRRPTLCSGCPHGHVFSVLRQKSMIIAGDIGCYTLGTLPPFEVIDTCVDMGASLPMAQGLHIALAGTDSPPRIAAVIGDSTFAHSGITGLLNACWNKRDVLFIVLDNATTAMTGMQPNPMSGERLGREEAPSVRYADLARAFGIPDDNFAVVDAYDKEAVSEVLDVFAEKTGVRLLVVFGMCVIEMGKLKKTGKLEQKKTRRGAEVTYVPKAKGGAR